MMKNNALNAKVDEVLAYVSNKIEEYAVQIVDRDRIVAWGRLRRGIRTKYYPAKKQIEAFVEESIAPYAQYVHEGRKPGKMPPVSMIEEWARKKRILSSNTYQGKRSLYSAELAKTRLSARINPTAKLNPKQQQLSDRYHSLAWAIARKMKHQELKPRRFLLEAIIRSLKELR